MVEAVGLSPLVRECHIDSFSRRLEPRANGQQREQELDESLERQVNGPRISWRGHRRKIMSLAEGVFLHLVGAQLLKDHRLSA